MKYPVVLVIFFIVMIALSFIITSGMIYGICWAFGWTFTWRIAFGVWLCLCVISAIFNNGSKKD